MSNSCSIFQFSTHFMLSKRAFFISSVFDDCWMDTVAVGFPLGSGGGSDNGMGGGFADIVDTSSWSSSSSSCCWRFRLLLLLLLVLLLFGWLFTSSTWTTSTSSSSSPSRSVSSLADNDLLPASNWSPLAILTSDCWCCGCWGD